MRTAAVAAVAALVLAGCSRGADGDDKSSNAADEAAAVDPGPRRDRSTAGASAAAEGPDTLGANVAGIERLEPKTPLADTLLALASGAPMLGDPDAAVVIVEFSDFECPFCARVHRDVRRVLQNRPDVMLVYMQFPILSLHPGAMLPSEASLEAHRQGGFWAFHDALFARRGALDRETILKIAEEQGLDVAAMRRALDERTHRAEVERQMAIGRDLGITGTPTFYINGYQLVGARPYEDFVLHYNVLRRASRRADAARPTATP